jgi:hemoglobin/transferrin/lactoferrin receptor protein
LRVNPNHEFKLTGEYFNRDATVDQKYDLGPGTAGSPSQPATISGYVRTSEQTRWRATLSHDWNTDWRFIDNIRWQVSYSPFARHFTGDRRYVFTASGDPGTQNYLHHFQEHFWEGDLQLKSSFNLGAMQHNLTYGYYGNLTKTDYERRDIFTNLTTGAVTTVNAGGFNFANADTIRSDGYIQDEIKLFNGQLTVMPGVRYSYYDLTPRPDMFYKPVPGKEPTEVKSEHLSKKVGVVWKLNENFSLFGQYAEGFKMPTAEQLYTSLPGTFFNLVPNPDLRPESVKSYEAGIRGRFSNGYFSMSVFRADYKDFIASFVEIPGTIDITYENRAFVQIRGAELFGEWQINDTWALNASLSAQQGTQITEAGQNPTPFNGASPLTLVTGVRYTDRARGITGELTGTFARSVDRATPVDHFKPGGYAVFDTVWSWNFYKNWTLRAAVYNILDTRYFKWPMPNEYLLNPSNAVKISNPLELQTQPGRTFKVGLNATF